MWRQKQLEQDRAALRTLGFESDDARASPSEIKEAYKERAQRWHPDRHSGAAEKAAAEVEFKKLGDAVAQLQSRWRRNFTQAPLEPIDPFHGLPWWHHHRFPPWSFARGPPYLPSRVGCAARPAQTTLHACPERGVARRGAR